MPQISVIVPVYKVEPYLRRCVDSILNQTFKDFELILVDDGSPDGCPVICDDYAAQDSRVHVIHQPNGGLSSARNSGIDWAFANSDSEWITFVDSDDWVSSFYLQWLYQGVLDYHVKVCSCRLQKVSQQSQASAPQFSSYLLKPEDAYIPDGDWIIAFACGRLYSKDCFSDIRFPIGKLYEDLYVTYKILFSYEEVALIDSTLYYYFMNSEGITHSDWTPAKIDQIEGYAIQIPFFTEHGYDKALRIVQRNHLAIIGNQILSIRNTHNQDINHYEKALTKELRTELCKLHRQGVTTPTADCLAYEISFPHLMRFYWIWKTIIKKILQ